MNQIKQLATILNWNDTYTIAYTKTKLTGKALSYIIEVQEISPIQSSELFQRLQQHLKYKSMLLTLMIGKI